MASISGPDPGRAGVQDRYLENDCLRNGERNPFRQHQGMALSGEDVERFPRRYPARSMTVARHSDTPETQSIRTLRVGEQVRHVLSEILARGEVHDETLAKHLVSITEVRMSPDLRHEIGRAHARTPVNNAQRVC